MADMSEHEFGILLRKRGVPPHLTLDQLIVVRIHVSQLKKTDPSLDRVGFCFKIVLAAIDPAPEGDEGRGRGNESRAGTRFAKATS